MRRTSFSDMPCSVARSLDLIGEWWTLLIVREAFFGTRHFGEFQKRLGIAPNVLTQRLVRLVEGGVLTVPTSSQSGRALEYRLTDKGKDLFPVIIALLQWGDKHEPPEGGPALRVVDRASGEAIEAMRPRSRTGLELGPRDVRLVPVALPEAQAGSVPSAALSSDTPD
jgi:DNA-binding HxlR family transcriptional regulator